jgi:hypothetical protein
MAKDTNRYCERLGIEIPSIATVANSSEASLFHVMIAALLERGAPMTLDEIAERLWRVPLPPRLARADLPSDLRAAWHGMQPIVHDTEGRVALNLLSDEWLHLPYHIHPRESQPAPTQAEYEPPGDDVPLSNAEVEAAFRNRSLSTYSSIRQAAAILETTGSALTVDDINNRLRALTRYPGRIDDNSVQNWRRTDMLIVEPDGLVRLNTASRDVPAFRRDIRRMGLAKLRARRGCGGFSPEERAARQEKAAAEQRQDMERARATRRAFVYIVPGDGQAVAAALIDPSRWDRFGESAAAGHDAPSGSLEGSHLAVESGEGPGGESGHRSNAEAVMQAPRRDKDEDGRGTGGEGQPEVEIFIGADVLEAFTARLREFDLLAGVDLRQSLRGLGLDPDDWLLAELRPTDRTHLPTDVAKVAVSLDSIVRATTGTRRRLMEPQDWRRLTESRKKKTASDKALANRLTSEARTLFALYDYGALHRGVKTRRATGVKLLPVSWAMPGDPSVHTIVEAAARAWVPIDVAVDPQLAPPAFKPIFRADVAEYVLRWLILRRPPGELLLVDINDLVGVRVADPSVTPLPPFSFRFDNRVCQLKVTMEEIEPPIWRRLIVPVSLTLERLHDAIQAAIGWTNSHLHVFEIGDERIGVPYELGDLDEVYTRSGRTVKLGDVLDRGARQFAYEYDFGDSWRHVIEVEDVRLPGLDEPRLACIGGARAAPPEDSGGVPGYERLLEILFDPTHEEFNESHTWVGPHFAPERFDLEEINEQMARVRTW